MLGNVSERWPANSIAFKASSDAREAGRQGIVDKAVARARNAGNANVQQQQCSQLTSWQVTEPSRLQPKMSTMQGSPEEAWDATLRMSHHT